MQFLMFFNVNIPNSNYPVLITFTWICIRWNAIYQCSVSTSCCIKIETGLKSVPEVILHLIFFLVF